MAKYRKKPIIVEAERFDGDFEKILKFVGVIKEMGREGDVKYMMIQTLEGKMRANEGDYIIKGIKGEFYPCKADIFEQTYELVEE